MNTLRSKARKIKRLVFTAHMRRRGVEASGPVVLYGNPRIRRYPGSHIMLGERVALNSRWQSNDLDAPNPCILRTLNKGARIEIGDDTGLTSATVSSAISIQIGCRVLIGAGAIVTDSDHHHVDLDDVASRRSKGRPSAIESDSVKIEDDVFIGARSIILKGSHIGTGSVIGAGSVVAGHVPDGVIFAGNPARFIRRLKER